MKGSKIDYSKLMYRSGDNMYFDFTKYEPLSSFYLKLMNRVIGLTVAKLNMKEFEYEIYMLKNKRTRKHQYKKDKEDVLKNAEALYKGLEIIADAFEKRIFEYKDRPMIDVDYETSSDTYGLNDKELQMFKKLFKYNNPKELRDALIDADEKKYYDLKNDIKIKQNFLNEQIRTKIGVERTRLDIQ